LTKDSGLEIVETATSTIRLAQRYRSHIRQQDWEDEKKLRRDAFEILGIIKRIAERDGVDVTIEESSVIGAWCKSVRTRIERDDEARREIWERARTWMEGDWKGREWGTLVNIIFC
jgi:hypothetical protein